MFVDQMKSKNVGIKSRSRMNILRVPFSICFSGLIIQHVLFSNKYTNRRVPAFVFVYMMSCLQFVLLVDTRLVFYAFVKYLNLQFLCVSFPFLCLMLSSFLWVSVVCNLAENSGSGSYPKGVFFPSILGVNYRVYAITMCLF